MDVPSPPGREVPQRAGDDLHRRRLVGELHPGPRQRRQRPRRPLSDNRVHGSGRPLHRPFQHARQPASAPVDRQRDRHPERHSGRLPRARRGQGLGATTGDRTIQVRGVDPREQDGRGPLRRLLGRQAVPGEDRLPADRQRHGQGERAAHPRDPDRRSAHAHLRRSRPAGRDRRDQRGRGHPVRVPHGRLQRRHAGLPAQGHPSGRYLRDGHAEAPRRGVFRPRRARPDAGPSRVRLGRDPQRLLPQAPGGPGQGQRAARCVLLQR